MHLRDCIRGAMKTRIIDQICTYTSMLQILKLWWCYIVIFLNSRIVVGGVIVLEVRYEPLHYALSVREIK